MKQSYYFSPKAITIRYIIDNIIQRVFANISTIQFEGNDAYVQKVSEVFKMQMIRDSVTEWSITFDETLWNIPKDKNAYRNIIDIRFRITGGWRGLTLDLRKNIDDYANLHKKKITLEDL